MRSLKILIYFKEGFRSFHPFDIGSVGQRAARLLAVKIGGLKKKSAASEADQGPKFGRVLHTQIINLHCILVLGLTGFRILIISQVQSAIPIAC